MRRHTKKSSLRGSGKRSRVGHRRRRMFCRGMVSAEDGRQE